MDQAFLEDIREGKHIENKQAWDFAKKLSKKYSIVPPEEQSVYSAFSVDPPSKFIVKHNLGTLFNYITLSIHKETPNRACFYLFDMKYKLIYENYIWYLFNYQSRELLIESHVFDPIILHILTLEN